MRHPNAEWLPPRRKPEPGDPDPAAVLKAAPVAAGTQTTHHRGRLRADFGPFIRDRFQYKFDRNPGGVDPSQCIGSQKSDLDPRLSRASGLAKSFQIQSQRGVPHPTDHLTGHGGQQQFRRGKERRLNDLSLIDVTQFHHGFRHDQVDRLGSSDFEAAFMPTNAVLDERDGRRCRVHPARRPRSPSPPDHH